MVRTERGDHQATKNKPGQEKIPRNTEVCHFVKRSGFLEHKFQEKCKYFDNSEHFSYFGRQSCYIDWRDHYWPESEAFNQIK